MPKHPMLLRSGCSAYDFAIVVSVAPFVLVSEEADMRWSATVEARDFRVIGTAKHDTLLRCMRRWDRDQQPDAKI
jgi:hypothetical protein